MNGIDTVSWAGTAKADAPNLSELDSTEWLGKAEAARLLGVHPRQLERRAKQRQIRKRVLPRKATEKAARVVYSRVDIEELKRHPPEADLAPDELVALGMTRKEVCQELGRSSTRIYGLVASGRLTPKTDSEGAEVFDRAQVAAVKALMASYGRTEPTPPASPEARGADPFAGLAAHLARIACELAGFRRRSRSPG